MFGGLNIYCDDSPCISRTLQDVATIAKLVILKQTIKTKWMSVDFKTAVDFFPVIILNIYTLKSDVERKKRIYYL